MIVFASQEPQKAVFKLIEVKKLNKSKSHEK